MYNWRMKTRKLPVILTQGDDGYIVAEIPFITGCISQGKTVTKALANIKEAAELCLENREAEGWDLPKTIDVGQIEIALSA